MPRYQAFCAPALLIIAVLALTGCVKRDSSNGDSDSGQTQKQDAGWFIEIASESGLDFVHQSGVQGDYFMPDDVNKQMTTGEGGMIVTDRDDVAEAARRLRNQGRTGNDWFDHETLGYNYRLAEIPSALGIEQLNRLDAMSARRAVAAARRS